MFPDTSNVMNGPQTGKYHMYPRGTPVADLILAGSSMGTVASPLAPDRRPGPGHQVQVPEILNLPIGLDGHGHFIDT